MQWGKQAQQQSSASEPTLSCVGADASDASPMRPHNLIVSIDDPQHLEADCAAPASEEMLSEASVESKPEAGGVTQQRPSSQRSKSAGRLGRSPASGAGTTSAMVALLRKLPSISEIVAQVHEHQVDLRPPCFEREFSRCMPHRAQSAPAFLVPRSLHARR